MFLDEPDGKPGGVVRTGIYHELAEAIRRGCKVTKPLNGEYISDGGEYACALGAAAIGTGFVLYTGVGPAEHLAKHFPELFKPPRHLWDRIVSKNDGGMSREEIADWLDSL